MGGDTTPNMYSSLHIKINSILLHLVGHLLTPSCLVKGTAMLYACLKELIDMFPALNPLVSCLVLKCSKPDTVLENYFVACVMVELSVHT